MLVVSDVEDVFLPKPSDLLVNLTEARASLEALLGRLGDMFQDNHIIGSALGPALQAGFQLMVRPLPASKLSHAIKGYSTVSNRRKNSRSLVKPAFCWRRCSQEQGGRENTGNR